jgi:hypothetical protein
MPGQIDADRRRFLGTATMSMAAAQFGMMGSAAAQPVTPKPKSLPPTGSSAGFCSGDRRRRRLLIDGERSQALALR